MDFKIDIPSALAIVYIGKNAEETESQSCESFCENFLFVRSEMEKALQKLSPSAQSQW